MIQSDHNNGQAGKPFIYRNNRAKKEIERREQTIVEIINFIIGRCDPASGRILQTIDDPVGVANFLRKESKLSLKVAIKHHWCQKTAETSGGQLIYDKCNNNRPNYQPNCIREADIEKIIDLTAPGEVKAKGALDAIRQVYGTENFKAMRTFVNDVVTTAQLRSREPLSSLIDKRKKCEELISQVEHFMKAEGPNSFKGHFCQKAGDSNKVGAFQHCVGPSSPI